ncbi:hypothetical protein AB0D12_28870 [Streptomyces sp. NPDC048479]|uniref:TetR family transcriptional regulator C-terminal domain-containing protein n=1 Tax=Streptomyces sp. NPDC048479 TaxID=3154725 RepID=UPI00341D14A7
MAGVDTLEVEPQPVVQGAQLAREIESDTELLRDVGQPAFQGLADDGRGLPAVRDFFAELIAVRCSGKYAGWGCMVVNAHTGAEHNDPAVRALLDEHHQQLRDAMCAVLETARLRGQLSAGVATDAAAEVLALLAYGVNLRSRAGADPGVLLRSVTAALAPLGPGKCSM